VILITITVMTEFLSRQPAREASGLADSRMALAEASRRNAEVVQAMGMARRLGLGVERLQSAPSPAQQRVADITGGMGGLSRVLRMALQSAVLGIGAYLVVNQQASAGIIIASSILTSRALAPVEVAIANWRGFTAARQSWRRLNGLLGMLPADQARLELPKPTASLALEAVSVSPPGTNRLVVQGVAFQLKAGQALGVIGPSASGKSSLARAIVGVWPTTQGKIRIDGAALDQWSSEALGSHIGYLPQDMELFGGTVRRTSRASMPSRRRSGLIAAAKAAGVHELILALPDGYETQVGEGGAALSSGAAPEGGRPRPRALRRAVPGGARRANSNLDREGDDALTGAILGVRARRRRRRGRPSSERPWPESTRC